MRIVFGILAALIVIGSFYADYRWRKWINSRGAGADQSAGDQAGPLRKRK